MIFLAPAGALRPSNDNRLQTRDPGNTVAQRALPTLDVQGIVVDKGGAPISGVRVKMFSNGMIVEDKPTTADGRFVISASPSGGKDATTTIWFQSPDTSKYLDVGYLVSASEAAVERELFPYCTERISLQKDRATIEVTLLSEDERKEALATSECLQGGAVQGPAGP